MRSLRQEAGLSQESLAEKAELHPVCIKQAECGGKGVSVEALCRLSRALRVPMSALFEGL